MSNTLFVCIGLLFFLLHLLRFESTGKLIELTLFSSTLIVLMLYDLRTQRVPKEIALAGLLAALFLGSLGVEPALSQRVLGLTLGYVSLACVIVISTFILRYFKYLDASSFALGAGDPLALAVIGSFMGYEPLPQIVLFGSAQAVVAHVLTKRSSYEGKPSAPLAAFMCLATLGLLL